MIICQTASCIILYFIIFIIQYIHYHIRPCLIIPHDTVNVFVYTSLYTTVFIATERNSIGIPTFYTYPYTITTPLSSVSLHDLHVSRWVPRKQRNVTLKTFYQARCVVKLATFWWSLSWFGILWTSRCFRFSNVTLQTFFLDLNLFFFAFTNILSQIS